MIVEGAGGVPLPIGNVLEHDGHGRAVGAIWNPQACREAGVVAQTQPFVLDDPEVSFPRKRPDDQFECESSVIARNRSMAQRATQAPRRSSGSIYEDFRLFSRAPGSSDARVSCRPSKVATFTSVGSPCRMGRI